MKASGIDCEYAGPLDLRPFGSAEFGGKDTNDICAVFQAAFECNNEVVAPFDGYFVEEAGDAVAGEAAVEFADEVFVVTAVAEKDGPHK